MIALNKQSMILSIIIPVYKVEEYVRKTINSVFSEKWSENEVEVIVVNDGTPDKSMEIVNEFSSHPSLHIINQENQGLSCARNTGIKAAKGKYVWFVDSDDSIEEGFLRKILPVLRDSTENVYMMMMRETYEDSGRERIIRFPDMKKPMKINGCEVIWQEVRTNIKITPMQKYILRRKFIIDNELFFVSGIYHEDLEYAPRMLVATENVIMLPWVGYRYLWRSGGSITTNPQLKEKRLKSRITIYQCFERLLCNSKDDKIRKAIALCKFNMAASIFNQLTLNDFREVTRISSNAISINKFKNDTIRNLLFDRKVLHLGRMILFLISPWFLKQIHKQL